MNQMRRIPACENIKALQEQQEQKHVSTNSGERRCKRTYASEETKRICESAEKVYRERMAKEKYTTYKGGQ